MAAVSVPRNSTTVRKSWMLSLLSARFAVGSWVAPRSTLARAFHLFCTPMPGARTRARQAEKDDHHQAAAQRCDGERHRSIVRASRVDAVARGAMGILGHSSAQGTR